MARTKRVAGGRVVSRNWTWCAMGIGGRHKAYAFNLSPVNCARKNGYIHAHRICHKCWFHPTKGFALEGTKHACPGCKRGLPLPQWHKTKSDLSQQIDLDSD